MSDPTPDPTPASSLVTGLRWSVSALSLGCLCTFLWALTVRPSMRAAGWLAFHLAQSPDLRSGIAVFVLGAVQALVCAIALGLLAILFEIATPVGAAAGAFAGLLPLIVMLFAQGSEALSPAPALIARAAVILLCALAGGMSVRRVRAFLEERVAPDDLDEAAAEALASPETADAHDQNPDLPEAP